MNGEVGAAVFSTLFPRVFLGGKYGNSCIETFARIQSLTQLKQFWSRKPAMLSLDSPFFKWKPATLSGYKLEVTRIGTKILNYFALINFIYDKV
jgi:hypothetical protein